MTAEDDPFQHLSKEPCSVCSSSKYREARCGYKSKVKLTCEGSTDGIWELGSKYALRDRDAVYALNDPDNHELVRRNTTIPVPKILAYWDEPGNRCMMIEELFEDADDHLETLWPTLSESDREDIARQTADLVKQLRSLTSDKVGSIKGGPILWQFIFRDRNPKLPDTLNGPYESDDEIFDAMTVHLKNKGVPEKALRLMRKYLGPAKPYTFTNTRLFRCNIMLKDKKVVGITDWQSAAYLPRWAEYMHASRSRQNEDETAWKQLLASHLLEEEFKDAMDTIRLIWRLENYPDLDKDTRRALDMIEDLADEEAGQETTEPAA